MSKAHPISGKHVAQYVKAQQNAVRSGAVANQRLAFSNQNAISGLLSEGITRPEDLEVLREYVESSGTPKQRRMFQQLERQFYGGKTMRQLNNASALKGDLAAIEQARSVAELDALQASFGNMNGSQELRNALQARREALQFEAEFAEALRQERMEGLMETFGKPAPQPRVAMTRAELYAKNGMVAPKITSDVALCDEIAGHSIKIGELTGNTPIMSRAMNSGEAAVYAEGLAQRATDAATIAQQTSTIAHQGVAIAEQSEQLNSAVAKISEQGQQLTDAGKKMAEQGAKIGQLKNIVKWGAIGVAIVGVGLGIWALLHNRKKNEQIAEQQNADAANQARIAELEQQLADCQEQQEQQAQVVTDPEQPVVGPENPEEVPGTETYDYTRLAVYGDCIWNYCKEQLTEELGRTPTNREVFLTSRAYREAHDIPLIDNYYAPLQPNDTLWSIPKLPEIFPEG